MAHAGSSWTTEVIHDEVRMVGDRILGWIERGRRGRGAIAFAAGRLADRVDTGVCRGHAAAAGRARRPGGRER
ncbi:Glutamate racemase [Burkholderia diffusa]|nr:Glutamate racemase [Burkholderia diffusa]